MAASRNVFLKGWQSCMKWLDVAAQMLVGLFWAPHAYLIFFVTARCNARCSFCFYWEEIENSSKRKELSLEEIAQLAKKLKHLLYLSIGGGEPFLRADLADLVGLFYRHCRTRFVNITTNGLQPERTAALVERMLVENPHLNLKLSISLDALGEKHDQLRKVPGNFKKILETHHRLCQLRERHRFFGLNIATTFSKFNEDEIEELIDFVDEKLDVNDHTLTFIRGEAKDRQALDASIGKYKKAISYLDIKHRPDKLVFQLLHNVLRLMFKINIDTLEQDRMIVPCVAGGKMITLDDQGVVKPCEMLQQIHHSDRFNIGDVRTADYDIPAVMKTLKAREVRAWIKDTKCHCTFECANMANVVFNTRSWPRVVAEFFRKREVPVTQGLKPSSGSTVSADMKGSGVRGEDQVPAEHATVR